MERFLIISPHTFEECIKALHETMMQGYITHFDWGCMSGDHNGYIIIEADNEAEAIMSVPPFLRHKARTIKLCKFTEDVVKKLVAEQHKPC